MGFSYPLGEGGKGETTQKSLKIDVFFKTRLGIYSQKFYQQMCFGSPPGVRGLGVT